MNARVFAKWFSLVGVLGALSFSACVTERVKPELTLPEQIEVDTKSAEGLTQEFKDRVSFVSLPDAQAFVKNTVRAILKKRPGFENEQIEVRFHDDLDPKLRRFFSFPGITLSIPISYLKKVEFENELAASLSFEIANIFNRTLAKRVEKQKNQGQTLALFSRDSVFNLNQDERAASVKLATDLLYQAGYDVRGIASIFSRYSVYYVQDSASDLPENQVAFYVREAQRAKSEYLPQMKPIVRSAEFIQLKKSLLNKRRKQKKIDAHH